MSENVDIEFSPEIQKLETLRASVIDIATRAGSTILKVYSSTQIDSASKDDNSPVTAADMASHHYICSALAQIGSYPVFSEEDPVPYEVRKEWESFWLVDPLDGTKNFLARDDQFTVNIALVTEKLPTLGVVHVPATGVTYSAVAGLGAWKRVGSGDDVRIFNESTRSGAELICAVSSFHNTPDSEKFCEAYGIKEMKKLGSSLKLCKLAEGEIDVYPRFNGTKEWDTAASQCIVEEANGKMIDITTGKKLVYNKEDYRNNYFIASRNDLDFSWRP